MKDLKIIFNVEGLELDLDIPTPSSIIFYTMNKKLYVLKTLIPASVLKSNNCYSVYGFLEKNCDYMYNILENNNIICTTEYVDYVLGNKEIFKSMKNKLYTIMRKQKINDLFN